MVVNFTALSSVPVLRFAIAGYIFYQIRFDFCLKCFVYMCVNSLFLCRLCIYKEINQQLYADPEPWCVQVP